MSVNSKTYGYSNLIIVYSSGPICGFNSLVNNKWCQIILVTDNDNCVDFQSILSHCVLSQAHATNSSANSSVLRLLTHPR